MAGSKRKTGRRDIPPISLQQAYDIIDWAKELKRTPAEIRKAISIVGHSRSMVIEYFAKRK